MARTWTLDTTLTITTEPFIAQDALFSTVYYYGAQIVYSWDGTTETDISGATFSGDDEIVGLAVFGGTLYAAVNDTVTFTSSIWKHTTGTSWTQVYDLDVGGTNFYIGGGTGDLRQVLAADGDRIVTAAADNGNYYIFASTDGTTWANHTIAGGTARKPSPSILGTYQTQLDNIIMVAVVGAENVIAYDTGIDWATIGGEITGTIGSTTRLIGYAGGYSWWLYDTGNFEIHYSDDYGATLTATGVEYVALGAERVTYDSDGIRAADGAQAYVWEGGAWVADGTTGSDAIIGFFVLGNELYAFTDNDKVYSGGALGPSFALTHSAGGIPGAVLI